MQVRKKKYRKKSYLIINILFWKKNVQKNILSFYVYEHQFFKYFCN